MPFDLSVDVALADRVRLGLLVIDGLGVRESDAALATAIAGRCRSIREAHAGTPSGQVPGVEEARRLYKALGLDPTKTRPSNEALLRRALKGEALYTINTLVDAVNLCSLSQQLPYGLYDLAKIEPPIVLRRGADGEGYEGIRKGFISVAGRPVLVDARGPFGNPTSDSARAAIGLGTRGALVVAYAPRQLPAARLGQSLDETESLIVRHCGGRRTERALLPPA
jgi:DNA/RNA-binding domain of Phe-tRNA-synthetase-like protein